MPIRLPPPRVQARAQRQRESFLFKSMLVGSALFLGCLVVANAEFSFSKPAYSLSETEAKLRLAR